MPPYYLSKVIKKRLGNSYKSLLQRRRLEESARLLTQTPMPVEAVVAAVGYENDSYFHRIFRQCYGLTPHDFRKRQQ
ncbi:MAG: helix-turn-helix domain-containing protein [Deltaproteobacteria bacterium]|nr:helix-turn-helix domain-containing protein [Deltaproteobacteria bacterium]